MSEVKKRDCVLECWSFQGHVISLVNFTIMIFFASVHYVCQGGGGGANDKKCIEGLLIIVNEVGR